MMRRLVERHCGILPLDTAESIWRVIIATFTYVQAPFRVHADFSAGEPAMRDCERLPFRIHGAAGRPHRSGRVVAAVAAAQAISGWCRCREHGGWRLVGQRSKPPTRQKIIARLPFVERADHPAGCRCSRSRGRIPMPSLAMSRCGAFGSPAGAPSPLRRWRALPKPRRCRIGLRWRGAPGNGAARPMPRRDCRRAGRRRRFDAQPQSRRQPCAALYGRTPMPGDPVPEPRLARME